MDNNSIREVIYHKSIQNNNDKIKTYNSDNKQKEDAIGRNAITKSAYPDIVQEGKSREIHKIEIGGEGIADATNKAARKTLTYPTLENSESSSYVAIEGSYMIIEDILNEAVKNRKIEGINASKSYLSHHGVTFKDNEFLTDEIESKASEIKIRMPLITLDDAKLMSSFIESNRKQLSELAIKGDIYIRREVTGLPLSMLVTSDQQVFWMLKMKAKPQFESLRFGGSFKIVQECVNHDHINELYVVATLKADDETNKKLMLNEIKFAKKLKNVKNTVQITHFAEYKKKTNGFVGSEIDKILLIMPYFSKGDLSQVMQKEKLSDQSKSKIFEGVIEGAVGIHETQTIHGDFRLENIFIDNDYEPYIGDFGSCHDFQTPKTTMLKAYTHPMFRTARDKTILFEQCDVYALGLTLAKLELELNLLPWETADGNVKSNCILKNAFDDFYINFPISTSRLKLIKELINPDIYQIPKMEEVQKKFRELVI